MKIVEIHMDKDIYQGRPWVSMSEFQKRKYENYVFLKDNSEEEIKIKYVQATK